MHSLSDEAKALLGTLLECIELQVRACRDWHYGDPDYDSDTIPKVKGLAGLRELIMRQHWVSFRLRQEQNEGSSALRVERLRDKVAEHTLAVNKFMLNLLKSLGNEGPMIDFGELLLRMSLMNCDAYALKEEAKIASTAAAHAPDDFTLARTAEDLLEKVGALDTVRAVHGRKIIDSAVLCLASGHNC